MLPIKRMTIVIAATLGVAAMINSAPALSEDMATVRVGVTPYFDYMPWVVAKDLGLDKEVGVDLELINIDSTAKAVAAMRRGSLDVVSSCHVCDFPLYESVPELRSWLITNQFKGFIVVGRQGAETYADLAKSMPPEEAKLKVLKGMKGKTFALVRSNFEKLLTAALSQAGLNTDDIKILEFSDDAQAALAFEKGVGDYYMGSLPQETKLLASPEKYVNVGGHQILGPAGLWFSTMDATQEWIDANAATVTKLVAIWYRFARYADEKFDEVAPMWVKATNERAAASFTVDDFKNTYKLLYFPTVEQAKETIFNVQSDAYWKNSVSFYEKQNADQLTKGFQPEVNALEERLFKKLLADKALMEWIESPLK